MKRSHKVLIQGQNNTPRVINTSTSTPQEDTNRVECEPVKTVGERIRQAREARGMTQAELALRVGFKNQSGVGNLEARATGRGGFRLAEIATVLCVPVQWLLNGPDTGEVPAADSSSHKVTENVIPVTSEKTKESLSPREVAKRLIERLPEAALREAIDHLEYLNSKHKLAHTFSAGDTVPAPTSRAA